MIAFNSLKQCGFGNLLFQYAFLRTTATRLGTQFYFPTWDGDKSFCLNDQEERTERTASLQYAYREPLEDCGFHPAALQIADGTDVWGYFQSEQYYPDKDRVRNWYTFSGEIAQIRSEYAHIDFANSVSLSLRIGDDYWGAWLNGSQDKTVIMPKEWFRPGGDRAISGIVCDNWIAIRALNPVFEHKVVWSLMQRALQ